MGLEALLTFALLFVLGIIGLIFLFYFVRDLLRHRNEMEKGSKIILSCFIGFITNFFDVFGIGSFAPGASLYKSFKQVEDQYIPGTLNVSCSLSVIVEAFIFIQGVRVELLTLILMLIAAMVGAWIGAGIISKLSKETIQLVMAVAMVVFAVVIILQVTNIIPTKGSAFGLHGIKLVIAVVVNFLLGAVMTAGVGLYAPCLALVCVLGMDPIVAFPIMMGSCAYLMPVASIRFIKEGSYNRKVCLWASISAVVGVIVATRVALGLPSHVLKIIVICVMFYTAASMFYSLYKEKKQKNS